MTSYTPETFRPLLNRLVKTPQQFTPADLKLAINHLCTLDAVLPAQVGAFLAALYIYRIEKQPASLAAAASLMREKSVGVTVERAEGDFVVDIVGTGGDGYNTYNVSTTAGVVAAGAGARVIKHGSHAWTSNSGSADILQSLGCLFAKPEPGIPTSIPRIPFTFILGQNFHPSLACISPYRLSVPFRTVFNFIGPLINPARPRGLLLGVAEPDIGETYARSLRDLGVERALVVCGAERLDEISCAGDTYAWELLDGKITERTLRPEQFGLSVHPLSAVIGGTPEENARIFKKLLTSGEEIPQSLSPVLDFVLMNAAALLVVAGIAENFKEGTKLAMKSITSGKAWEALETFRDAGRAGKAVS